MSIRRAIAAAGLLAITAASLSGCALKGVDAYSAQGCGQTAPKDSFSLVRGSLPAAPAGMTWDPALIAMSAFDPCAATSIVAIAAKRLPTAETPTPTRSSRVGGMDPTVTSSPNAPDPGDEARVSTFATANGVPKLLVVYHHGVPAGSLTAEPVLSSVTVDRLDDATVDIVGPDASAVISEPNPKQRDVPSAAPRSAGRWSAIGTELEFAPNIRAKVAWDEKTGRFVHAGFAPGGGTWVEVAGQDTREQLCGEDDMREALQKALPQLPSTNSDRTWDIDAAYLDTYDKCSDISVVEMPIQDAVGSSIRISAMFHRGQFVGSVTKKPYGFGALSERVVSHRETMKTLFFPRQGEANAEASGRSTFRIRWNASSGHVEHAGDLPPGSEWSEAAGGGYEPPQPGLPGSSAPVDGAFPGAGGPAPATVREMRAGVMRENFSFQFTDSVHLTDCYFGFTSDLTSKAVHCKTYLPTRGFVEEVAFDDSGAVKVTRTYLPHEDISRGRHPRLLPGQQVKMNGVVCASESEGLTCWKEEARRGVVVTSNGVKSF